MYHSFPHTQFTVPPIIQRHQSFIPVTEQQYITFWKSATFEVMAMTSSDLTVRYFVLQNVYHTLFMPLINVVSVYFHIVMFSLMKMRATDPSARIISYFQIFHWQFSS